MINFFDVVCRHEEITDSQFGICDNQNGTAAYVDTESKTEWIATVNNPESKPICFTAIDNCIEIRRDSGDMDSRCH